MRRTLVDGVVVRRNSKYYSAETGAFVIKGKGILRLKENFRDQIHDNLLTESVPFNQEVLDNPKGYLAQLKGDQAEFICLSQSVNNTRVKCLNLNYIISL